MGARRAWLAGGGTSPSRSATLARVLELPVLSAAEALGGSGLADDHRVVGVCVIEVPVDGFVRRGELILSTAMGVGPLGA